MSEIKLSGIPSMNVGNLVNELSKMYCAVIGQQLPVKTIPAVMLWGAPGVGKSQAIRQLAREIEENTGKRVKITDVRLLLFNPIDLRGIPTSNADKTLAVWLKPQIFQMDESEDVINILFLDELSAARSRCKRRHIRSPSTVWWASIDCRRIVSSLPRAIAPPINR